MLKKVWFAVLFILFIIAIWKFDIRSLWIGLLNIPYWLIALLFLLQVLSLLLVNLQWLMIAKFCNMEITFWEMFYANSNGAVVDSVTPGVKFGGEVTRTLEIKKLTNSKMEDAVIIVTIQKLFSMITFIFLCLLTVGLINVKYIYYFIPVLLLLIGLFFFLNSSKKLRFPKFLKKQNISLRFPKFSKMVYTNLFVLSLLIWLLYPLKLYILVSYLHSDINIFYIGTTTFMAYLVAMIPIFPGGLGGFEATMTGMLVASGIASTEALMLSLVFRFFTFWLVMIFSLLFVMIYRKKTVSDISLR